MNNVPSCAVCVYAKASSKFYGAYSIVLRRHDVMAKNRMVNAWDANNDDKYVTIPDRVSISRENNTSVRAFLFRRLLLLFPFVFLLICDKSLGRVEIYYTNVDEGEYACTCTNART